MRATEYRRRKVDNYPQELLRVLKCKSSCGMWDKVTLITIERRQREAGSMKLVELIIHVGFLNHTKLLFCEGLSLNGG